MDMKAELAKEWKELRAASPKTIAEIKSRIAALSRTRKLSKGRDKTKLERAKRGLDEIGKSWDEAQQAFHQGSLADAMAAIQDITNARDEQGFH